MFGQSFILSTLTWIEESPAGVHHVLPDDHVLRLAQAYWLHGGYDLVVQGHVQLDQCDVVPLNGTK